MSTKMFDNWIGMLTASVVISATVSLLTCFMVRKPEGCEENVVVHAKEDTNFKCGPGQHLEWIYSTPPEWGRQPTGSIMAHACKCPPPKDK